jgi:putative transposase
MARSHRQIYIHIIWSTKGRAPVLRGELETFVHSRIRELAAAVDVKPLIVNSAWNHLHGLFQWNTTVAFKDAICEWKSRTFNEWRSHMLERGEESVLHWQDGGGIFSVSGAEVERLIDYIARQKEHHEKKTTNETYELW